MEATKTVTVSLVLPMIGLLLRALDQSHPILCYDYDDMSSTPEKNVVKVCICFELLRCYNLEFENDVVVYRVMRLYHLLIEPDIS